MCTIILIICGRRAHFTIMIEIYFFPLTGIALDKILPCMKWKLSLPEYCEGRDIYIYWGLMSRSHIEWKMSLPEYCEGRDIYIYWGLRSRSHIEWKMSLPEYCEGRHIHWGLRSRSHIEWKLSLPEYCKGRDMYIDV